MGALPASEYLEISPEDRRRRPRATNRGLVVLAETPLQAYSDSRISNLLRSKLVKAVIDDLVSEDCAWCDQDRVQAIKVIKELSRLSGSSEILATTESIEALIRLTNHESPTQNDSAARSCSEGLDLALRVLNNVLYQHSEGRGKFASVGGMELSLHLIGRDPSAVITFLAARLVFFSTLFEAEITRRAVEELHLVDIFVKLTGIANGKSQRIETLLDGKMSGDVDLAMAELQKAFFNVGLYYPRLAKNERNDKAVVGERFHEALLPFLSPTLRLIVSYPTRLPTSLSPPITNAIAVLLNYPVSTYQGICTSSTSSSSSHQSSNGSNRDFLTPSSPDFLTTLLDLLDEFLHRYFVTLDPDDSQAETLALSDQIDLQDYAEPALLLCRKLIDEVELFKRTIKLRLLPSDIDRTQGLDKRKDLTGILVRLLSSSVFPRLARASGEVLLALCDGEAKQMTAEIGYGPCAGFLMSIGQMHSLPGTSPVNASGQALDPVTGQILLTEEERERQDREAGLSMTEEEKEAEAERLFSLFDRLDRTGVIKVQNPLQHGVETGRIQELEEKEDEEERQRIVEEDAETERAVERDMKAFREKEKRSRE
ncbi:hypothetical protein CBS101457_003881 [Exobasidium rhododendri]|nr:hypothetical protein CBS101457_003881 [Exobasidium rhododendri]